MILEEQICSQDVFTAHMFCLMMFEIEIIIKTIIQSFCFAKVRCIRTLLDHQSYNYKENYKESLLIVSYLKYKS